MVHRRRKGEEAVSKGASSMPPPPYRDAYRYGIAGKSGESARHYVPILPLLSSVPARVRYPCILLH